MIEYFDVVDESDRPTGTKTTKSEAHDNHVLHRVAAVYVFDQDGNFLVQDHKSSGMFDHSVGGHVAAGEDYLIAAMREADEELGIRDVEFLEVATGYVSDELFDPVKNTHKPFHMFGIYECKVASDWRFVPNDEVESVTPKPLQEVVADMHINSGSYTPGFINAMAKYLEVCHPEIPYDLPLIRKNWSKT